MKIILGFAATAVLGLAMGGCGSSSDTGDGFGPDPDLASVQSRFDKPDGTVNSGNAASILASGASGSSSSSELDFSGTGSSGSGSTVTKKSIGLHILDATSGNASPFACTPFTSGQQSGSCSCPGGGSIDYVIHTDGQGGSRGALLKMHMNACSSTDTTIDGNEYLSMRTDTTDQQHPQFSMLMMIDATVSHAGVTHHVDLQSRYSNGAAEIAVKVDDGWVVVSVTSSSGGTSGTWTVRDRNGSWSCTASGGHGTCTSDKGDTRSF